MDKQLVNKYNTPKTLLVFSNYALTDQSVSQQNALAWFTRELLAAMPKKRKIVVFSEKAEKPKETTELNNILVVPTWKKNDFLSILNLIRVFGLFNHAKTVLFQFEFNIFGSLFGPLITLILLMAFKLMGKRVYFQLHQVVLNISAIQKQVNLQNRQAISFFNISLKVFYILTGMLSEKIIITESTLANRLSKIVNQNKIGFIPIPVKKTKPIDKISARKKLGFPPNKELIILFFGYLSWYKGIDWLLSVYPYLKKKNKKLRLVIAGDKSPTLANKFHYQQFYNRFKKLLAETDAIHTGFISDKEAGLWFSASDTVILPYKSFISSSGPLSWALTYRKPVILSGMLKDYCKSEDFSLAMEKAGIGQSELFFDLEKHSLASVIKVLDVKKMTKFSRILGKSRSQKEVAKKLDRLLFPKKYPFNLQASHYQHGRFHNLLKLSYGGQ